LLKLNQKDLRKWNLRDNSSTNQKVHTRFDNLKIPKTSRARYYCNQSKNDSTSSKLDEHMKTFSDFLQQNNISLDDIKLYDDNDLKQLLEKAGFIDVIIRNKIKKHIRESTDQVAQHSLLWNNILDNTIKIEKPSDGVTVFFSSRRCALVD